jgi:hypothetical protein
LERPSEASDGDEPELDLTPLQGLMPRLEVKVGRRDEWLDARTL